MHTIIKTDFNTYIKNTIEYLSYINNNYSKLKIFIKLIPFSIFGSMVGTYAFVVFPAKILAIFFAIIL